MSYFTVKNIQNISFWVFFTFSHFLTIIISNQLFAIKELN